MHWTYCDYFLLCTEGVVTIYSICVLMMYSKYVLGVQLYIIAVIWGYIDYFVF